ncbi:brachyurin [Leptinotarsa decemlineata]|uniref:brachyurin n=1 Tax=Leptinotarsa decemlineata TaxID=7539 RepID=UPI003D30AFC5
MKVILIFFLTSICALKQTRTILQEKATADGSGIPVSSKINFNPRIIGGATVVPNSYPFQAAIQSIYSNFKAFCGGTLITSQWVLTAAHCVDRNPKHIEVVLGAHNLSVREPTRQYYKTTNYKMHPWWNATTLQYDIALIKLRQNATLNSFVGIVSLAKGSDTFDGRIGITLGWGQTETGNVSSVLKGVEATILSNRGCRNYRSYNQIITPRHICTSGSSITGPKGSCNGDSGGPLLVNGVQVGIVSFGPENCMLSLPSVFTRVNKYVNWIERTISSATRLSLKVCYILSLVFLARFISK